MKYYVIRIITSFDNTETRNIMPFDTRDEAEIRYHNSISADMSNKDVMKTLVLVLNSEGGIEMSRNWKAEAPIVE
ncbi:MAG: hypothetical protein KBS66_00560 [Eubacterium sp.]|nr:hypothetical protein [Candidatus Colimonas fimequi]